MKETSKAVARRQHNPDFVLRYFVGQGLDIGGVLDPLGLYAELFPGIRGVRLWDNADGDPQYLTGIADNSVDFVHAAHVLQRQADPREALRHWVRVLRPGGHLIVLVPDEDLYEQGYWPSRYSPENRWSFTLFKTRSWSPVSLNLIELVQVLGASADIRRLEVIDAGFRHRLPRFDQSLTPVGECAIELVIRKRPQAEAISGGRFNPEGPLSPRDIFLLTGLRVEPKP
jgi:SAM-dependent methyltransferase